jgi:hypothetical protein
VICSYGNLLKVKGLEIFLKSFLLFSKEAILLPFLWVGVDIIPNFQIIPFSTDYVVVEGRWKML